MTCRTFIRKMAEEDTGLGREMRQFLEDTYRFEGKKLDNVYFDRWAAQWQDRLETIAGNDTLRAAMTKDVPDKSA